MQILVTGATGFIGSCLVGRLAEHHEVFGIRRGCAGVSRQDKIVWIDQDLTAPLRSEKLPSGLDAIIHLAQSKNYKEFPEKADDIFAVNVDSTFHLLEYARQSGVRTFILASTGGVYGYNPESSVETDPVNPLDFYFTSKCAAELLVGSYQRYFQNVILRFFFVYGPGQDGGMLIPRLVHSVRNGTPIVLQGDDGIRINPTYVSDAAVAIRRALDLDGSHKINVGGPEVLSLREIAQLIGQAVDKKPAFDVQPDVEPQHLVGDISKMSELLVAPRVGFEEGIGRYIAAADHD